MFKSITEMDRSACTDEYQKLVIRMSTPRSAYYSSFFSAFITPFFFSDDLASVRLTVFPIPNSLSVSFFPSCFQDCFGDIPGQFVNSAIYKKFE